MIRHNEKILPLKRISPKLYCMKKKSIPFATASGPATTEKTGRTETIDINCNNLSR